MGELGLFPFGMQVERVVQRDRQVKKAFVLGVYASAVHARWIGTDGKQLCRALAVRSEPEIFWRGEGAAELIAEVNVPKEAGVLETPVRMYNGPSGTALDDRILAPLGLERDDAWLCDLVPHACVNDGQQKVQHEKYTPVAERLGLVLPSMPVLPAALADDERRDEIADELMDSGAEILILLGDLPIRWFIQPYAKKWNRLSDFGTTESDYGRLHEIDIAGSSICVLPVAHPRQIARLGHSSSGWFSVHEEWVKKTAGSLLLG